LGVPPLLFKELRSSNTEKWDLKRSQKNCFEKKLEGEVRSCVSQQRIFQADVAA